MNLLYCDFLVEDPAELQLKSMIVHEELSNFARHMCLNRQDWVQLVINSSTAPSRVESPFNCNEKDREGKVREASSTAAASSEEASNVALISGRMLDSTQIRRIS